MHHLGYEDFPLFEVDFFHFFCFPVLHILLMVNNILEKISSDIGISIFETFQKSLHTDYGIKWQSYHGISLEGNDCRKLLRITNDITWPEQTPASSIDVLVKLDSIVTICFSSNEPDKIAAHNAVCEFKTAWILTGWPVTLKSHYITSHLLDKIEMLEEGEGLGVWSETACESSHSAFRDTYTRFKGQESDLMKACCEYNSMRLKLY